MKKLISLVLVFLLAAGSMLCLASCSGSTDGTNSFKALSDLHSSVPQSIDPDSGYNQLGKGKTKITVIVENAYDDFDSKEIFIIKTDKKHLGEALTEVNLIEGEKTKYGLFINRVMGVDVDNKTYFWAIYIGDKQAQTGVDGIHVKAGATYTIKREKIK